MATGAVNSSEQTKNTIKGVVIGGLAGVAAVAAAPVLLPAIGLGALSATGLAVVGALPWLPAAIGGYMGYKKNQ